MVAVTELSDVAQALRIACKVDYRSLPAGTLGHAVGEVQKLKAQVAALETDVVAAYDISCEYRLEGHKTAVTAMRYRCRMHGGEAAGAVRLARALRDMPGTQRQLHDAFITPAHARRLAKAASRPEFADAEEQLLEYARTFSFKDFDRAITYWEQIADDNRVTDDSTDPRELDRQLLSPRRSPIWAGSTAGLDPIGFSDFFEALRRIAIQARDRCCIHSGCEVPARRCEIDHVEEWDDDGHTVHTNGAARCSYHHRHHKPRPG